VPEPTNRRGFLRALVQSAGETIGEFTSAVNDEQRPPPKAPNRPPPDEPTPEVLTQAPPATRTLTMAELDDLVAEEGLAARRDALRALVRPATRLTPTLGAGPERSWLGRPADAPREGVVPIAEIDLADPALADGPLAGAGRLRVHVIVPAGGTVLPCTAAQIRVQREPGDAHARSMNLSTELTLPRAWAAPVQALDLDETEHAAYERLRTRVAELQGVSAEDGDADGVARHLLLGYPTETSGTMPLTCELASRGLDTGTAPADIPEDARAAADRWRLLLQVTRDEAGGVRVAHGFTRLYLWIDREALERQDFSEAWTIAR
jgi:hypothetical protein